MKNKLIFSLTLTLDLRLDLTLDLRLDLTSDLNYEHTRYFTDQVLRDEVNYLRNINDVEIIIISEIKREKNEN